MHGVCYRHLHTLLLPRTLAMTFTREQKIFHTLRIAAAMCFIGHGAFGIITKEVWCNYFGVVGIGREAAYTLMPVVGCIDILMGLTLLIYPTRAIAGWLVMWGFVTASLRPLSGEPFAELIERAGNYGAPLALLILSGGLPFNVKGWFSRLSTDVHPSSKAVAQAALCLRVVVFLLLLGHGWLNVIEKKGLIAQYTSLGFLNPATTAHMVGIFEFLAATIVLVRPLRPVLIAFFIWKMGTELFYPKWEIFEWIERGGSYGAILALWFATKQTSLQSTRSTMAVSTN